MISSAILVEKPHEPAEEEEDFGEEIGYEVNEFGEGKEDDAKIQQNELEELEKMRDDVRKSPESEEYSVEINKDKSVPEQEKSKISELESTLVNKTAKAKKEIIKSRILPEPLRERKFVLWQKVECKNRCYGADTAQAKKGKRYEGRLKA